MITSHYLEHLDHERAGTSNQSREVLCFVEGKKDAQFYYGLFHNDYSFLNLEGTFTYYRTLGDSELAFYGMAEKGDVAKAKTFASTCVAYWFRHFQDFPHLFLIGIVDKDFGVDQELMVDSLNVTDRHDIETTIAFYYPRLFPDFLVSNPSYSDEKSKKDIRDSIVCAFELSFIKKFSIFSLQNSKEFSRNEKNAFHHLVNALTEDELVGFAQENEGRYGDFYETIRREKKIDVNSFLRGFVSLYLAKYGVSPSSWDASDCEVLSDRNGKKFWMRLEPLLSDFLSSEFRVDGPSKGEITFSDGGWGGVSSFVDAYAFSCEHSEFQEFIWNQITSHDVSFFLSLFNSSYHMRRSNREGKEALETDLKNYVLSHPDIMKKEVNLGQDLCYSFDYCCKNVLIGH
jgi:hypothetical protein